MREARVQAFRLKIEKMVYNPRWLYKMIGLASRRRPAIARRKPMRICGWWRAKRCAYVRVGSLAPDTPPRSRHIRFAPEADKRADVSLSPLCTRSVINAVQQTVFIRAPRRRGRAAEGGTPIAPHAHALLRARVSAT